MNYAAIFHGDVGAGLDREFGLDAEFGCCLRHHNDVVGQYLAEDFVCLTDRRTTNHASKVYVRGTDHTQTVEGFFSTVKLGLSGVFHGVSRQWLQTYINEYVFRYNHRTGIDPFPVLVALSARPVAE